MPGSLHAGCRMVAGKTTKQAAGPKEVAGERWHWEVPVEGEIRVMWKSQLLPWWRERGEMDCWHVRDEFDQPWAHAFHVLQQIRLVPSYLLVSISFSM